ncbi:AAA family ATPase [Bradyrhizobium manausense]|uniref:AAA family ATPase n=1 Tax=Bradyrhizobium manausense TaxID=989370 RepID=UPI001BA47022|nr:AAA family ATPase [Bradyrhizobium manausense]MBR0792696.1 AAA family ATPase [Bradyrhizobium manausense]
MSEVKKKSRVEIGELAIRSIVGGWKGANPAVACEAAFRLGQITDRLSEYDRTSNVLRVNFAANKVDEAHWQDARDAFANGRCSEVKLSDVWQRYAPTAANDNSRFDVTWFDDVNESVTKEEIVKGFLGVGEFSLFVAKPGTGKSVLLCDIGCHIAAGVDWHGRKVKQGLVVFFAAERKSLTERRVAAWRKKHGVFGIPFVVVGGKLDLTGGLVDAKALASTVRALEAKCGYQCVLIIVDTVTRTFGGGDQNASKDMQRYIQSVDELHRATGAHVAAVHHSGWEGDRGKGAIDLDGAIDVSFGVTASGKGESKSFVLECTGANDGDEGVITAFRLESVSLGVDPDGNETTAPVVVPTKVMPGSLTASTDDGLNLRGNTAKAFEALRTVLEKDGGEPGPVDLGYPDGVPTVTRDAWRNRFYADVLAKEPALDAETLRQRFHRASGRLIEASHVGAMGARVWLP